MGSAEPSPESWREALAHFERLIPLDAQSRADELATLAHSRPDLYPLVVALLQADRSAEAADFLARDAFADVSIEAGASSEVDAGARFGAYRLEKLLGSGGTGDVWLARRTDERFDSAVALKVLHAHVAQSSARERFIREGRILGQLSHPHIARLLDAGATPSGVLYLVLEYVEGAPIDRWCDDRGLDIPARLRLFLQVCAAVSHAHTHLVVHRDLKPANILVSPEGEIKLLDFGVAKLVEPERPGEETELTRLSGRALTPEYAAPEQILGHAVTMATDVYALGVILYLLLSGRRPHRRRRMTARELERQVLTEEASPLARALRNEAHAQLAAERRGSTPQKLRRMLSGDLSAIVAKALRTEPERRYPSVEQLSADIVRYLEGRPVQATRGSWVYRARKFALRHTAGVAVSAVSVALLVGFAIAMSMQIERTMRERERAEQVSSFLAEMFEQADPFVGRGSEVTVRELLDISARRVETSFAAEPETRAVLMRTMGAVYNSLGMPEQARPLLEQALDAFVEIHGPTHPDVAATLNQIGAALIQDGKLDEAQQSLQRALAIRRERLGSDAIETAESLHYLGRLAEERGDTKAAERHYRDSLEIYTRRGASARSTPVMNELASFLGYIGRYEEAAELLKRALAIDVDALGEEHPSVIAERHNLGFMLQAQGRAAEAEPVLRDSVRQGRSVLGPEHPYSIDMLSNLGRFLRRRGASDEAEQILREAMELNLRVRGAEHPLFGTSQVNLAILLHDAGKLADAEQLFRAALATYAKTLPPDHVENAPALSGLGRVLIDRGRATEAGPHLRRALAIAVASVSPENPTLAMARTSLATQLVKLGEYAEAEPLMRDGYDVVIATQGEKSAVVRQARETLASLEKAGSAR